MATIEIYAMPRSLQGTGASRRLRETGKVPGIIYGGEHPAKNVEFDHNGLFHQLKQEAFHASILSMTVDGKKERVLLRDVQMHPFKNEILHVDFQRVDENRKIHMKVPLHFANGENSPAVKVSGAIVSHVLTELDITCLPKDLPEFIVVDLTALDVGHSIHVSALALPPGVSAVTRAKLDPVVAAAVVPKAHVEEVVEVTPEAEAAAAAAAAAGIAAAPGTEGKPAADAKGKPTADAKGAEAKESGKEDKKKASGKDDRKK